MRIIRKNVVPAFLFCLLYVGVIAQTSTAYSWKNVAIGGGGFVTGIITSKEQSGLMYARTDVGGAYRWDVTNSTWIPLMDWASENQQGMFGTESIAIDPQSPNIVYMSAGISYFNSGRSYILRSTDYGANFTITEVTSQFKIHGNGMGRQDGERLQVDPNNSAILYCGTRSNGLWKSADAGATWTRLNSLDITTTTNQNGVCFVIPDKTSVAGGATQRIFAGISRPGNDQNFYKSEDAGATFTAVINPSLAAGQMPQRAVLSGDGNLIITYGNGGGPYGTTYGTIAEPFDQGQIWKYNIAAGAWTNITPTGYNKAFGGISVDPNNPQRMVASTINVYNLQYSNAYGDRLFYSTNGGANWTDIVASRGFVLDPNGVSWITGQAIHWAGSIEFDPSNTNRVLVTSGNGIFVNENIATSNVWKFNVKGFEETVAQNLVSIPNGPVISVIGDYDGFRHTDVSQYAPIHNPKIGTTTGLDYATLNTSKLVRVGSSMYYSNDMGVTWTKTTVINGSSGQVALSANGNVILHSPGSGSTTYRSADNGTTWTTVTGLNVGTARPVADPVNSNKFYAYATNGTVMVSNDGGVSFTAGGSTGTGGSKIIRTVPGREGHLWVPLTGNGLYRSINSGTSFTKISTVTTCTAVGIGKAAPAGTYETIYIWGTVNNVLGIHRSTDEGATWVRVNDEAHEYGGPANGQFVVGDMNVYGRVYMSTAGRGIVYGDSSTNLPVTFTGIHVQLLNKGNAVYARLVWKTATETNNNHFDIERSFNGTDWHKITVIASKATNGNSNNLLSYDVDDEVTIFSGHIYYRVKQVDADGRSKYSSIVSVNKVGGNNSYVSVYPNPVIKAGFKVRLLSVKEDMVSVKIINMLGSTVYTGKQNKIVAGENVLLVNDVAGLASGMYLIQIFNSTNQLISTSPFTK